MLNNELFIEALAGQNQPQQACAALEALCQQLVGVKLFTLMTNDSKTQLSERIYTNMPKAYPTSGTKPYNQTEWSRITLEQKQTFVANTIEDIANVFDDHETILALGCESVINVPIEVGGEVIGTINCLHEKNYYTPERIAAANALKLPAAICFMLAQSQTGE